MFNNSKRGITIIIAVTFGFGLFPQVVSAQDDFTYDPETGMVKTVDGRLINPVLYENTQWDIETFRSMLENSPKQNKDEIIVREFPVVEADSKPGKSTFTPIIKSNDFSKPDLKSKPFYKTTTTTQTFNKSNDISKETTTTQISNSTPGAPTLEEINEYKLLSPDDIIHFAGPQPR